jgi:nucleoside-diphosphate-sugar epimerase
MNLEDRTALPKLFKELKFDMVCNLAAQAWGSLFFRKSQRPISIPTSMGF